MLSICFKHLPYNEKSLFIHSHRMYFNGFGDIQNISLNKKNILLFFIPIFVVFPLIYYLCAKF